MLRALRVLLASALVSSLAAPALAQVPGASDPDARELAAYKLTLPTLDKVLQATKNLAAAAKSDPRFQKQAALKAELKKLAAKEEPTDADSARMETLRAEIEAMDRAFMPNVENQTLSQMAAAMEKEPLMARALGSAGVSAREYAKFLFAYMSAGAVAEMLEQGAIKEVPKELADTLHPDNITFFRTHKAEVLAFQKAFEALGEP